MKVLHQGIKFFIILVLLCQVHISGFAQLKHPKNNNIDSSLIKWVTNYYDKRCAQLSSSNKKEVQLYSDAFFTDCIHVHRIGEKIYDSVTVDIYVTGVSIEDVGCDKILVQREYKNGISKFEFIWDNPRDIDQIVNITHFFEQYKGFSEEVQLICYRKAIWIYQNTK